MQGWLKKESGGNKWRKGPSIGSLMKKEQKRWFVLTGSSLAYFSSPEHMSKGEKGVMQLEAAYVEEDSAADLSLTVTSQERVLALRADDSSECERWLRALRAACGVNVEREHKLATEAAAAAAQEAKEATMLAAAATIVQKNARGKAGREKAAVTCPPCVAACKLFVVDTNAAVFGTCMCGFKKEGHSARALKGKSMKLSKKTSTELRAKMVQREKADCDAFVLSMDPSLPFGTCQCGRPRAEHTEAALKGGAVSMKLSKTGSAELRAKMVQREKAKCTAFVLNMDPSLPFGTCQCGRPRAEHTAAALAADAAPKTLVKKSSTDIRAAMDARQENIGTAIETQGARVDVAFGIGNTVRTAADEEAAVQAAIAARAGGVDKAAALSEFNEMMTEAQALTPRAIECA